MKFLVGINKPWFHYGRDLSGSEFGGTNLWYWPHTAQLPNLKGLVVRDDNPLGGQLTLEELQAAFSGLKGLDVVRFWLHEQFEGLSFSPAGDYRITGLKGEFITNLKALMDVAHSNGLKVYLTLFNGWDGEFDERFSGPVNRREIYRQWSITKKKILRQLIKDPSDYARKALAPILDAVKNHPALFAIDLCNEPEGLLTFDSGTLDTVSDPFAVNRFIGYLADFVKGWAPGVKVSVGAMTKILSEHYAKTTKIDFGDFHTYSMDGVIQPYFKEDYGGKPCIIGECGHKSLTETDAAAQDRRILYCLPTVRVQVATAQQKGYAGILAWPIEGEGSLLASQNTSMNRWLADFARRNLDVAPVKPKPWDPWNFLFGWIQR